MNSKKTFITLGIVVAVLALGIAYAAINQQTLNVVGNVAAATSDTNFTVKFDETYTPQVTGDSSNVAQLTGASTAKLSVGGLTTENQQVTATYKIVNASTANVTANVAANVSFDNTEWFDVTASLDPAVLAQNGESLLTVTVTLKKTPVSETDLAQAVEDFLVTITATPQSNATQSGT